MTERARGGTNVRKSRNKGRLHSKVLGCLMAVFVVGAIATIDATSVEELRSSKYRRTDVDFDALTSLNSWQGIRSNVQCASLCEVPECSAFRLDLPSQQCNLFTGRLVGAVEPDYTIYMKVPDCPTQQGFQLVTVSSETFCIGVFSTLSTAQEASQACRDMDSILTVLDTAVAYDALALVARHTFFQSRFVYVGMFYDAVKGQVVLEHTGEPPTEGPFWNTHQYQPDGPSSEPCMVFNLDAELLHDGVCYVRDIFSCQKII